MDIIQQFPTRTILHHKYNTHIRKCILIKDFYYIFVLQWFKCFSFSKNHINILCISNSLFIYKLYLLIIFVYYFYIFNFYLFYIFIYIFKWYNLVVSNIFIATLFFLIRCSPSITLPNPPSPNTSIIWYSKKL